MASKNPLAKYAATFSFDEVVRLWGNSLDQKRERDFGKGKTSDPMYYADVLIDPMLNDQYPDLLKVLDKMATEAFGSPKDVSFPLQVDTDELAQKYPFLEGMSILRTKSNEYAPRLRYVNDERDRVLNVTDQNSALVCPKKFYPGVYCGIEFALVPYEGTKNIPNSIAAYVREVTSVGYGDNIGGTDGTKKWAKLLNQNVGTVSDYDPTVSAV